MKKNISGFTLIELMITVAVIAVLATIAIPNFQSTINSQQQNSTYKKLINVFNTARNQAVTLRQEVVVNLNSELPDNFKEFNWSPENNNNLVEGSSKISITFNPNGTVKNFDSSTTTFSICNSNLHKSKRIQVTRMGSLSMLPEGDC